MAASGRQSITHTLGYIVQSVESFVEAECRLILTRSVIERSRAHSLAVASGSCGWCDTYVKTAVGRR
jgi:hypothetical protein